MSNPSFPAFTPPEALLSDVTAEQQPDYWLGLISDALSDAPLSDATTKQLLDKAVLVFFFAFFNPPSLTAFEQFLHACLSPADLEISNHQIKKGKEKYQDRFDEQ